MPEWLGLDWWRYAWGPALAAGLVWLASTWKTTGETRTARDARLDSRQDKEMARLDAENEDLRRDYEVLEERAMLIREFAVEQRHDYLDIRSALIALRLAVISLLDGVIEPDKLRQSIAAQGEMKTPPKVPPLREAAAKRPD